MAVNPVAVAASHLELATDMDKAREFLDPAWDDARPAVELFQTVGWFEHLTRHGFATAVKPWLPCWRGANHALSWLTPPS